MSHLDSSVEKHVALIVDDDDELRRSVGRVVHSLGYQIVEASGATEAIARLGERPFELVVTDLCMPPGPSGHEVVRAARARQPNAATIVLTGQGSVADCVESMRAGATNFVTKPFHVDAFLDAVRSGLQSMRIPRGEPTSEPARSHRRSPPAAPAASLIGISPPIRELLSLIEQVAPTHATVLLTGETGTGKEVVARLLHGASPRSSGPFVAVNCGAIPENLIESELFGHARGAFTGATERRIGRFVQANGGSLFLDEIGELPLHLQVRFLRVLQTREVMAVGESKAQSIDVRIIAATNRDLAAMIEAGQFREDLYYRLNVVQLSLPPLRDRAEDIEPLFRHFVERGAAVLGRAIQIAPNTFDALRRYRWPGNVRELENLAERMVVLDRTGTLTAEQLPANLRLAPSTTSTRTEIPSIGESGIDLELTLEATAWRLIDEALRQANGNKAQAARLLGINRTTLVEKLKRRGTRPVDDPS